MSVRRRLLLSSALAVVLGAARVEAAIAYASECHNDAIASTSVTVTCSINSGDNLVVSVFTSGSTTVSSVTMQGGGSLTNCHGDGVRQNLTLDATRRVEQWCVISASASTSITVNTAASVGITAGVMRFTGAVAFGNGPSSCTFGTNCTNSTSTSKTVTVTTQDANNYIACAFQHGGARAATPTSGTEILEQYAAAGVLFMTEYYHSNASAGSTTCSYTHAEDYDHGWVAIELRSTTGAAPRGLLLGVLP